MTTPDTDTRGSWASEETESASAGAPSGKLADVPVDADGTATTEAIRETLKAVMDPEIGINIVDLGLVYSVAKDGNKALVEMTLTSMGCPLTELIHQQCTLVLTRLPGIDEAEVNFVFSPPWSTDMISEDAQMELRAMGFNV